MTGLTLSEVLVVLALFTLLAVSVSLADTDGFAAARLRQDRDSLMDALYHARSQAMNGVCGGDGCSGGSPHGVRIADDRFTVFSGESFEVRDTSLDEQIVRTSDARTKGDREFVFQSGTGDASPSGHVSFLSGTQALFVSVNAVGLIDRGTEPL